MTDETLVVIIALTVRRYTMFCYEDMAQGIVMALHRYERIYNARQRAHTDIEWAAAMMACDHPHIVGNQCQVCGADDFSTTTL